MERFYTLTHPLTHRVRLSFVLLISLLIGLFFATFLTAAPAHAADETGMVATLSTIIKPTPRQTTVQRMKSSAYRMAR